MERRRIRVRGIVQGVGYRPFVYRTALVHGVAGWVRNDTEGVLVEAQAPAAALATFTRALRQDAPALADVREVVVEGYPAAVAGTVGFVIQSSERAGLPDTIVPADAHVCDECRRELDDPSDRRHGYPFVNCTHCGPRYSLIRGLPYDRAATTMAQFVMCAECRREYENPLDRRYHAQPVACPACGPRLALAAPDGSTVYGEEALARAAGALVAGMVVAVKSVGGFHLAVDARDADAVARLRRRKRRDAKPFALMAADLATTYEIALPTVAEVELLTSPARPIVLLRKRPGAVPDTVAPRNPNLGVMLPSAPLHVLLHRRSDLDVLVMTSGNVSSYPIAFRNDPALRQLPQVADLILYHDRDIEIRVDDSVLRCSAHPELPEPLLTFIRRSRGYAPYQIEAPHELRPVVAYGAELKSTVAVSRGNRVYVSQHVGDLKNEETFSSSVRTAEHLVGLHELTPRYAACDLHPDFRSSRYAQAGSGLPAVPVQHHHAHMASCMAENGLSGRTLGVIFDGAGYGEDGTIWGGEFLLGDYLRVDRVAHLRPVPLVGGDRAVREPIRTGFALAVDAFGDPAAACAAFAALGRLDQQTRHVFARMVASGLHSPLSSGMGRLFDGVAALLGVCSRAEYEAQGPIELEGLLDRDPAPATPYPWSVSGDQLDPRPLVRELAADLKAGVALKVISRRFHSAVVSAVVDRCTALRDRFGVCRVVLSGGVFLNEFVLLNCVVELRRGGFDAYSHRRVPANDGGISLGQVMVADARLRAADGNVRAAAAADQAGAAR